MIITIIVSGYKTSLDAASTHLQLKEFQAH